MSSFRDVFPALPGESNRNYAKRWAAWEKEQRATQYAAELQASEANEGKVPLPTLAEIVAKKTECDAEKIKLDDLATKEKDAEKKDALTKIVESVERSKDYYESLERLAKGEPPKEDSELLAKLQAQHDKDCADIRAWLAKRKV
jgi:hypothetical protein